MNREPIPLLRTSVADSSRSPRRSPSDRAFSFSFCVARISVFRPPFRLWFVRRACFSRLWLSHMSYCIYGKTVIHKRHSDNHGLLRWSAYIDLVSRRLKPAERRKVIHFNITEAPTAEWTAQPVVNAFPYDTAPQYLLRDRDSTLFNCHTTALSRTTPIRLRRIFCHPQGEHDGNFIGGCPALAQRLDLRSGVDR